VRLLRRVVDVVGPPARVRAPLPALREELRGRPRGLFAPRGVRDAACPISTRRGTRLVRLVRGRGGGARGPRADPLLSGWGFRAEQGPPLPRRPAEPRRPPRRPPRATTSGGARRRRRPRLWAQGCCGSSAALRRRRRPWRAPARSRRLSRVCVRGGGGVEEQHDVWQGTERSGHRALCAHSAGGAGVHREGPRSLFGNVIDVVDAAGAGVVALLPSFRERREPRRRLHRWAARGSPRHAWLGGVAWGDERRVGFAGGIVGSAARWDGSCRHWARH